MSTDFEQIPLCVYELLDEILKHDPQNRGRVVPPCSDRGTALTFAWGWNPPLLVEGDEKSMTMHGIAAWQWYKLMQAHRPAVEPKDISKHSDTGDVYHSDDFRSMRWFGTLYTFTATQAACVRVLYEAWKRGTPVVGQASILEAAGSNSDRLRDVFEKGHHPAWTTLIQSSSKGSFRLVEPEKL